MANENRYYKTAFAESGNRAEVPDVSTGGAVGYDTGFGPDYELAQGVAGRKRVERNLFNGVLNSATENVKQWQESLYPTWIEDNGTGVAFSYPVGMVVNHSGQNWISNDASNQDEPGTGTKWVVFWAGGDAPIAPDANLAIVSGKYYGAGGINFGGPLGIGKFGSLEVTARNNSITQVNQYFDDIYARGSNDTGATWSGWTGITKDGDWGIGALTAPTSTDADAIAGAGLYYFGPTWTGSPFAGTIAGNQGYLSHQAGLNSDYALQQFWSLNSAFRVLSRRKILGVWDATWTEDFNAANTNFNVFGGVPTEIMAHGVALSATQALFYLPLNSLVDPTGMTFAAASNFYIARGESTVGTATSLTVAISSSKKLGAFVAGLTGLTANEPLNLRINSVLAAAITVNY